MIDNIINDGQARRIASEWHGGQVTALYSFSSCGFIARAEYDDDGDLIRSAGWELLGEIEEDLEKYTATDAERRDLQALQRYVRARVAGGNTGAPTVGWATEWDETPPTPDQV